MTTLPSWLSGWAHNQAIGRPIRVIGIDLGTTNSAVAEIVWSPDSPHKPVVSLLQVPQSIVGGGEISDDLVPSVVATADGKEFVGHGAKRSVGKGQILGKSVWFDTKNEIGTSRRYHSAPEGFQTPTDIAAKILGFLHSAVLGSDDMPIDRCVVTVPASFQLTQRQSTIDAATAAGIDLHPGNLLDEPIAALLDFLNTIDTASIASHTKSRVMVVDFGGGTCDVALLTVRQDERGGVELSRTGVSRFTRLGGVDINKKIALDVLLPRLLEESGLGEWDLDFKKKEAILERLSVTADQLKQALSERVNELRAAGQPLEVIEKEAIELPAPVRLDLPQLGHLALTLPSPRLSYQQLDKALNRFLDPHGLEPAEGDYVTVTSIFAPIRDALSRVGWLPERIDRIVLVGGSGLLLPVERGLANYFPNAEIDSFSDASDAQRCVARGAAWHAFFLEAFGDSPVRPTLGEQLVIRTSSGPQVVVGENTLLPIPGPEAAESMLHFSGLVVPKDSPTANLPLTIQLEVGRQEVRSEEITLSPPLRRGDPIDLYLRFDENQVLTGKIAVTADESLQEFPFRVDNPLSVSINPNERRERIMQLEAEVYDAEAPQQMKIVEEIADIRRELGDYERARHLYSNLATTAEKKSAKANLYKKLADVSDQMGDRQAADSFYERAIESGNTAAAFKYVMTLSDSNRYQEALDAIDTYWRLPHEPVIKFLKARVLLGLSRRDEGKKLFHEALEEIGGVESADRVALSWISFVAGQIGEKDIRSAAQSRMGELDNTNAKSSGDKNFPEFRGG